MYAQGFSTATAYFHAIQGIANPCKYKTWISTSTLRRSVIVGPSITTGYEWDSDGVLKQAFRVCDNILSEKVWAVSPTRYVVKISEEAVGTWYWQGVNFPLTAELNIAKDSKSFVGIIASADEAQSSYSWKGSAIDMPTNTKRPLPVEVKRTENALLLNFDLFTVCNAPPLVQQIAQDMLTRIIQHAVDKSKPGWSKIVKDAVKCHSLSLPDLTPDLKEIDQLPSINSFYINMAMLCIGISLYHSDKKSITVEQNRKMSYYFLYHLSMDSIFIRQANAVYRQAFLLRRPRLRAYLDDQESRKSNGQDEFHWARQLHKLILSPASINTFVFSLFHSDGNIYHQVRDYGTVLGILQPSGELVLDAYKKLFLSVLATLSEKINFKGMRDKISLWVVNFVENLLDRWRDEEPPVIHESAHKLWESSKAFKQAATISGHSDSLANRIADLIAVESKDTYDHSIDVADKVVGWLLKQGLCEDMCHGLKRGVVAVVHLVALVNVFQAFLNWQPIDPTQMEVLSEEVTKLGIEILLNLPNVVSDSRAILRANHRLFYTERVLGVLETLMETMAAQHQWDRVVASTLESGCIHFQDPFNGLFETLPQVYDLTAPTALLIATLGSICDFIKATDCGVQERTLNDVRRFANTFKEVSRTAGLSIFDLRSFAGPFATLGVVLGIVKFITHSSYSSQQAATFSNDAAVQKFIDSLPQPPSDFAPGSRNL